jgi:hypothetical protein
MTTKKETLIRVLPDEDSVVVSMGSPDGNGSISLDIPCGDALFLQKLNEFLSYYGDQE